MGPLPQSLGEGVSSLRPPHDVGGAPAAADDPSRIWLPELVQRFAGFLAGNEVACTLRLVNKAAATQLSRPRDRTVKLSQPVPHTEFAWRWGGADAMRSLTRQQLRELPSLTASSGCIANLEVLLALNDTFDDVWKSAVRNAAASAGQLEACRWLQQQGCPFESHGGIYTTYFAAGGGNQELCEWLLTNGSPVDPRAAGQAAAHGHVGLMDWLLGTTKPSRRGLHSLLAGAARGCDLPILQRLHHTYLDSVGEVLPNEHMGNVVAAAAASPTVDWRTKVEWLEGRGYPCTFEACAAVAERRDGLACLQWLRQRGYPLKAALVAQTGCSGNIGMLRYLLAEGVEVDLAHLRRAAQSAAVMGHVAFLRALVLEHGCQAADFRGPASSAAMWGRLPVVEALVEMLGAADVLNVGVFRSAAHSGSMELLAWLHAHGCPWDQSVFSEAVEWGSEEQLEWLAAHGCPMEDDGAPYLQALARQCGYMPVLRCLRRLSCPWGPEGCIFISVVTRYRSNPSQSRATLQWLLEEGYPMGHTSWVAAVAEATRQEEHELLAWMWSQRKQHRHIGARLLSSLVRAVNQCF